MTRKPGKILRRLVISVAILVSLVVLAAGGLFWAISQKGSSPLKRWIGSQIQGIVGTYINPQLTFDNLDYRYPLSVSLDNFRLTAADPDHPGQSVDILTVKRLHLELAEIPSEGQPIRIAKLILDKPVLRIVTPASGQGGVLGFSQFLKPGAAAPQESQPKAVRLSEVFRIRLLQLKDGQVIYEPRGGKLQPMQLDAINTTLNVEPAEAGWYRLSAKLKREPVFDLSASGRIDLDHMVLAVSELALSMQLGRDQDRYLPPQLQQILQQHQVSGQLNVKLAGTVPLADALASQVAGHLDLIGAKFAAGEYQGQAEEFGGDIALAQRKFEFKNIVARMLGGRITGNAAVGLAENGRLDVTLAARQILLEKTLQATDAGGEPKYRGLADADVQFGATLDKFTQQASGKGVISVRQGKLLGLPVMGVSHQLINHGLNVATAPPANQWTDQADVQFTFAGDHLHFDKLDLKTETYGADGSGDVWFDHRLNLAFNVRPELHVLSRLGVAGEAPGKLLGKAITFNIAGTTDEPRLSVKPPPGLEVLDGLRVIDKIIPKPPK